MKITSISIQAKNPNRVNVFIDGKYYLSLDIFQVSELGLKQGQEISESELAVVEEASAFGKLYTRTLEYLFIRPHSAKEIRDYLWRKTQNSKYKTFRNEIKERVGVSRELTEKVYNRLVEKGYIDDRKFAAFWVEHRNQQKGSSSRKLITELRSKGITQEIITTALSKSERADETEIDKIIAKKAGKYKDEKKLIVYLARQGFSYDLIRSKLKIEFQDQPHEMD